MWCKFFTFALFWSEYFEATQSESKRIFWSEYSFSFEANQSESKQIFWSKYSLNEANWKRIRIGFASFASKRIIKEANMGHPTLNRCVPLDKLIAIWWLTLTFPKSIPHSDCPAAWGGHPFAMSFMLQSRHVRSLKTKQTKVLTAWL